MSRPLLRAAVLLLAAACSRSAAPPPPPSPVAEGEAVRPGAAPAAATRLTPAPGATARIIRPRPDPCLPADPTASPKAVADEARRALEGGQKQRALDCSEEALRASPRSVAGLAVRADALTALDRLDEARLAYAHALAIEPENPVTLLGAAELYVRHLSGERDSLETGLEYALRGARAALRPPYRDRELAAEHQLLAGMAENDLGRNGSALAHLDRALAVFPNDPDVIYERGVALFELCRFEEAHRTFERALSHSPDDPWVLHQLGLLAERQGDSAGASRLLSRAQELDPGDFAPEVPVDERAFRAEVDAAIASLPAD
ncbi:MAG TPA: tetratricopeptide repeat protein, partial [Anaeromyxobacter sp.]|nr:tetratricopeptide repeat protein [Anaeromyxobacter sp.]